VGEVLLTALGPAIVVKRGLTHGGIELLVRVWRPGKDDGSTRVLSHWPQQVVQAASADSAEARGWAMGPAKPAPLAVKVPNRKARVSRKAVSA
jgi:hypothetical protein